MAIDQSRPNTGFTLIELLVAIGVIALLVAILLPTLGASRGTARTAVCLSNQRQLMSAWETVMIDRDGDIPLTRNVSSVQPQWWELLKGAVDSARFTSGVTQPLTYPCPEVAARFDGVFYNTTAFGQSVNTRWVSGSPANPGNERQQWANVLNPGRYPWLADGWVITPHLIVVGYVGYSDNVGDDEWGVGFYHPGDTTAAAFADGHAELIERAEVAVIVNGEPAWFLNR